MGDDDDKADGGKRPRSGAGGIPCASDPSTNTMPHGTSLPSLDEAEDSLVITIASAAAFDDLRDSFLAGFFAAASAVSSAPTAEGDEADEEAEFEANLRRSSAPIAAGE